MHKIEYAKGVAKDLKGLPKEVSSRAQLIIEKNLAQDPYQGKPLKGVYRGLWKYRVGDYRIIYKIEQTKLVVFVLRIRHRREVYRGILN